MKPLAARPFFAMLSAALLLFGGPHVAIAFQKPDKSELPNFDKRSQAGAATKEGEVHYQAAVDQLKARVPEVKIDLHPVLGSPRWIMAAHGFLSGPNGVGRGISPASAAGIAANDPHRITKAFLKEHRELFGHGPEALATARIKRQFIDGHNGMKTVVWQQQLDGIDVFEGVLKTHTTRHGELVNIASQFVANPDEAAHRGHRNRAALQAAPVVTAKEAVARAAENLGERLGAYQLRAGDVLPQGAARRHQFRADVALKGPAYARLVWLPLNGASLRLCWEVILTSRTRGEMFCLLMDSETGEALVRHGLTAYLSPATYRVFVSDSPSPFSPGHAAPSSVQPPLVDRSLVTLNALNTNASPAGWINDNDNETRGNNVDAHTDHDSDDVPDTPRPQGSPSRTFDFPMNLQTDSPLNYSHASVVQLFYLNNWMHDRLYELGFTEAAGNFQEDNFARGGEPFDAVQADAQDGGAFNNANMSTPPDGLPARMQMYLFNGSTPWRDSALDAEIVLHEYTHGLSNRRVGGGVGISELQSAGLGEGWSDFYGLALLAEANDNLGGNWASGGYSTYLFSGLTENYYFGIRRYPYSTDLTKNPLTFKDIDPSQASAHAGIPMNPIFGGSSFPEEVHNQGEVWCAALWEVRANLVRKHGFSVGNQLTLQLVTDGMNLSPANPNFVQARDAIIQAEYVLTAGANRNELWAGFAKRGLGFSASSPVSSLTLGVVEAFDVPDDLVISPASGFSARGPVGGPFKPLTQTFLLANAGTNTVVWSARTTAGWLTLSNTSGTLIPGGDEAMSISVNTAAFFLEAGIYTEGITFSNHTTQVTQTRQIVLSIGQLDFLTEQFDRNDIDLHNQMITFTPDGSPAFYAVCREPAAAFPTDPRRGKLLSIGHDDYTLLRLAGTARVSLFGESRNAFYVGANGYVNLGLTDTRFPTSLENHFSRLRISGLFARLEGGNVGRISWQQLPDRVAVTYEDVVEYGAANRSSFQIELFYDERIRLTHLDIGARNAVVGLSRGRGVPSGFFDSDLGSYDACAPRLAVSVPAEATEGDGTLAGQARVLLPGPVPADLTVTLSSSDASEVTVPATVVLAAGQTNAPFDLFVVDDGDFDGTHHVIISASAPQYNTGSEILSIHDNEAGVLGLSLPISVSENADTVSGVVSVIAAVTGDIVVNLSSSAPSLLEVPPFVLIPNGTNAASFVATLVDDTRINGVRNVQIRAQVQNWPDSLASVDILDNENFDLTVTLPASASEFSGLLPGAGRIQISGTLTTNLTVGLFSTDLTELMVPATVTILSGQTNATFDLTTVDDNELDGNQSVNVTARAGGFNEGTAALTVIDDETPPPPGNPRPPNLSSNIPLNVELAWSDAASELLVNGDFEAGDLRGWTVENQGNGLFRINDGTIDPGSPDGPLPPFAGRYNAFTDQDGGGRHTLAQDVHIPGHVASATLRWAHRIRNHAAVFSEGQHFRVEIRDINNTLLAVAFSTQPGDELLQDWQERSFDLGGFRGQTIRIAFTKQDNLFYFNAHVDNVSVQVVAPNPPVFDVYFGTDPTPGQAQFLGTTASNSWRLAPLAPRTRYYWQVVARRIGQAASPVWEFTTRGVDHFELNPVATTQHVGAPFAATVTARDELNGVVSNFAGAVAFDVVPAVEQPSYTLLGTPEPEDTSVSGPRTYGYSFTPDVDLRVTHLRHYSGAKVSLWTDEGALLVSVNGTANPRAWKESALPSPLTLQAGRSYRLGVYVIEPTIYIRYDLPRSFLHGTIDQGYESSVGDAFPEIANSYQWLFVDLRYVTGAAISVPITPLASGNFVNGSWSGPLTILATASNVVLRAQDGDGHMGVSNPFNVRGPAGVVEYLEWGNIPSAQVLNTPFAATLSARDSYGNIVSNFNQPVSFTARRDVTPVSIGDGTNRSVYPLATFFQGARSQVIYLASELGGPQIVDGVSLHVAAPPRQSLENWAIRMKHTVLSGYGSAPVWEWQDWTTVFQGQARVTAPGWITFTFDTPFAYDGHRNLMIDFTFRNDSFSLDGECYVTPTPDARSINLSDDFEDPIGWIGEFPRPEIYKQVPNLQLHPLNPLVAVTPSSAGAFSNGVWSGTITVGEPAAGLRLYAAGNSGLAGRSNPFDVGLRDDISLSVAASPTFVAVGDTLTYTIRVTNTGPSAATGVIVTNVLAPGVSMVSVATTQGSCSNNAGIVRCNLGTVSGSGQAIITIRGVPTVPDVLTHRANVTRSEPDFYLPNNMATNSVVAETRYLTVSTFSIMEGNAGRTNALFDLKLSIPAAEVLTVEFATSDISAAADSDYVATNGSVVFHPGETQISIPVAVLGDALYEQAEVFNLDVSTPPNANVTVLTSGTCIIENDDQPPVLSVRNATVVEGHSGTTNAVFRLELSEVSGYPVTLSCYTEDNTAQAGADYVATNVFLSFEPGQTNMEVSVTVIGDTVAELDETFDLSLDGVEGASYMNSRAVGTILTDDIRPLIIAERATLISEVNSNNVIEPGEMVTVNFVLRNSGSAHTTNLVATLLPTGGVSAPSGPQTYGLMPVGGGEVARPFTFTANGTNGGTIIATLQLQDGSLSLDNVTFAFPLGLVNQFRIVTLSTNGCFAIEHASITGDDHGGIAASSAQVFYTGDNATARFALSNLGGGTSLGLSHHALTSDLRTETVYSLGNGNQTLPNGGGTFNRLLEINGNTGALTGNSIPLSTSILMNFGSGIFAGYGQVVVHNGSRVYSIAVPSGTVTDLGAMVMPPHNNCESWAFWGVAEALNGSTWLTFVQGHNIARTRVPDGQTQIVASFLNLSDMCSFTVSLSRNRWYFHHEGTSQFRSGNETIGYCDATFALGSFLQLDRFEWEPIAAVRPWNAPFPVTIRAMNNVNQVMTNFTGTVALSAQNPAAAKTILNSPVHDQASSGNFTLGYAFRPNTNLTVTHVRHYSGGKVSIWTDAGVLLRSVVVSGTPGTWSETSLSPPLALNANSRYRVGSYTANSSYYWRSGLSNSFSDGVIEQGYIAVGDSFPSTMDSSRWWFVDLRYMVGPLTIMIVVPTNSGNFINGIWNGNVTVQQPGSNIVLRADDDAMHHGISNPFRVVTNAIGELDHFAWSLLEPTQLVNAPFPVTITARDQLGNTATDFNGVVTLGAQGLVPASFVIRGNPEPEQVFVGHFTLGFAFTPLTHVTVTHFRHYSGTKVSIWNSNGTVLASQVVTNEPGAWNETPLVAPLHLTAGTRYRIGFLIENAPYYRRLETLTNFSHGSIDGSFYALGDQLPNNAFADGWWLVDLRFEALELAPVTVLPSSAGNFINGVWSGNITVTQAVTSLILRANDGAGHTGESNPFHVITGAPRLMITTDGRQAVLTWSAAASGFVLESAPLLGNSSAWWPTTNQVHTSGNLRTVTNAISGSKEFYRLRRP